MSENIENIVIEHLRAMRGELASIKEDTREIKARVTSVEEKIASLMRESAGQYGDIIQTQVRYDKLVERLERIERRLEIA